MENLPIPRLRSGWVAALLIAVIAFLLYYLFIYEFLFKNVYENQFDVVYFEKSSNQIDVWISVPRYYTPSEPAWIYVYVKNKSNDPIYDLEVYVIAESPDAKTLLLPNLYHDKIYSSGTKFDVLSPKYVSTARISFVAQEEPIISKVLLIQNRNNEREEVDRLNPKEFVRVNQSNIRALQHNFLEIILLPPWSNGFILALVLFSVYLVHKKEEMKEPDLFGPKWWDLAWETVVKSVKVLIGLTVIIFILLLINEITAPPIFCMLSLFISYVLEIGWLCSYLSNKIIKVIIRLSYSLAIGGIFPATMNLVAFFNFLFSDLFSLKWLAFDSIWVWYGTLVFVIVLLWFKRKSPVFFNYPLSFWANKFFAISAIYVILFVFRMVFLNEELSSILLEGIVSWGILASVSLMSLIYWRATPS